MTGGSYAAGRHLIVDVYSALHLSDTELVRHVLLESVKAIGATLVDIRLKKFGGNGGVSGVAVLAESHISIHTWPEHSFAAVDVFLCGNLDPERCLPVLSDAFETRALETQSIQRGSLLFPGQECLDLTVNSADATGSIGLRK